jgi:hypothetical protein
MRISLTPLLATLSSIFRSRATLQLENLALRHQIGVLRRSARTRPKLTSGDRLLWVWLSRVFNVTAHPTAEWTGQQLREAFPFDQLLRYLLRDRDSIFGDDFREQVQDMGIREILSTTALALAASLCGTSDWIDSTRVPRSCDRVP